MPANMFSRHAAQQTVAAFATLVLGIAIILPSSTARSSDPKAGETPIAPPESVGVAEEELSQLSRGSFSQRQSRMLQLWADREGSHDVVQQAARSAEPEVAGRANWILDQWRRGIVPQTPPEVVTQLKSADPSDAVQVLLDAGLFEPAVVAVEESLGTIEREALQASAARTLKNSYPIYARLAFEQDAVPALLRLVDLVADSSELAICRLAMMRWLGMEIGDDDWLPNSAESWNQAERDEAIVIAQVLHGRMDEAKASAADAAGEAERLLRTTRMLAGNWKTLAQISAGKAREAPPGSVQEVTYWSEALTAADKADLNPLRQEAIEALISAEATPVTDALRWQSLAVHGKIEAACQQLRDSSPERAAELAIAAAKPNLAFDILGYPLQRVESELDGWLNEVIKAQAAHQEEDELADEVEQMLALMKCLVSVGRKDLGWQIADRLSRTELKIGRARLRAYVMAQIPRSVRAQWCCELAVLPGEEKLSVPVQNTLALLLPDTDNETFQILIELLAKRMPRASLDERVEAACQLIRGEIPSGFDPKHDFKWLYNNLPHGRQHRLEQLGGRNFFRSKLRVTMGVADLFLRHNQVDLAERCLKVLAGRGESEAIFELAAADLEAGRIEAAQDRFNEVWDSLLNAKRNRFFRGPASLAAKAIAGQYLLAMRVGDQTKADRLEQLVKLIGCAPSAATRLELVQYLQQNGAEEMARDGYKLLLPMIAFDTKGSSQFYRTAYEYASFVEDSDPGDGARWLDLAFRGQLQSTEFSPLFYVIVPLVVKRWQLDDAIARTDRDTIRDSLAGILELNPLDITFAEEQLPKVREAGMEGIADEVLNRLLDDGLVYCQRFPYDATSANNLAWVAAVNHRRLDDALVLSKQAVYWEPESAVYRDTLAEILYRLGRSEEALQIEKACLLDSPDEWHLHEQIERFATPFEED